MGRDKSFHVNEDNLEAKVVNYDPETKQATLRFVNHEIKIIWGNGHNLVVGSLRLPSRYFLRISYGALFGQDFLSGLGEDGSDDYVFKEGEIVWYNSNLLERLLKKKQKDVERIEVVL